MHSTRAISTTSSSRPSPIRYRLCSLRVASPRLNSTVSSPTRLKCAFDTASTTPPDCRLHCRSSRTFQTSNPLVDRNSFPTTSRPPPSKPSFALVAPRKHSLAGTPSSTTSSAPLPKRALQSGNAQRVTFPTTISETWRQTRRSIWSSPLPMRRVCPLSILGQSLRLAQHSPLFRQLTLLS